MSENSNAVDKKLKQAIEARIAIENARKLQVDTLSNLTSIGTIGTGVWNGTAIAVGSGGTGLSAAGTSGFIPVSNGSAWVMQAIDGGTYS